MIDPYSKADNEREHRRILGWVLLPLAIFPLVALLSYDWHAIGALQIPPAPTRNLVGALGDTFAYYGYLWLGIAIWFIPVLCIIAALMRLAGHRIFTVTRFVWTLVGLVASAALVQMLQGRAPGIDAMLSSVNVASAGGIAGYLLMTCFLEPLIGGFGAALSMGVLLLFSTVIAIGSGNIAAFFVGLFRWASQGDEDRDPADESDPRDILNGTAGSAPIDEDPKARRERERAEKRAAKEAARAAKEEAKAAKRAEKEAKEAEKAAALERVEADREAELANINAVRNAARAERDVPVQGDLFGAPPTPVAPPKRPAPAQPRTPAPAPKPTPAAPTAPVATKPTTSAPTAKPANEPEPPPDKGPYILPSVSLLNPLKTSTADHSDVGEMSQRLVDTLKLFGIDASVSYTVQGPVVTKYALDLAPGTRYTAVTGLSDNLMGALRAKSLRIEAPIPGEDRVGMEVPNRAPAGISFREIFESDAWKNAKAELPLLFGKRADGKELVSDLASMPHMLVAGATGQGKSVCLNSLICGLLMTRTPEQLKLIMVDPKCVEFTPYASIPHLLVPVITDNKKVVFSLHWAVAEMEKRLKLFARAHVKNIKDFNNRKSYSQTELFGEDTNLADDMPKTVPYIVIIIDEAADLIGQCGKEVNPDIQRITQKARAAGIHLILATQRPDAKIITGAIKANIPGRVAFKTASSVDSRTILDDTGAENLIGKGDMLFKGKDGLLIRAQGAWISDDEIERITSFIEQHANTQFDDRFTKKLSTIKEAEIDIYAEDEEGGDGENAKAEAQAQREMVKAAADADDFKKAVECVINTKRASTSHFQRQMGWGYNHAAKILDELTARGIVSPPQGMGPRSIIMEPEQLMAILNGEDATAQIVGDTAEPQDGEETLSDSTTQTGETEEQQ